MNSPASGFLPGQGVPASGSSAADHRDRASVLLPLFRSLSALCPSSAVWKNADPALAGVGDVDWVAPAGVWDAIVDQVRTWAPTAGLGPVVVCRHLPDGMFVLALDGAREFFQLDLRCRATFRGSTVFRVEQLAAMTTMDPRGFRRLRPGAEGLLKFVLKGLDWGGRPRPRGLHSERVLDLLREDPTGVRQAAALFEPAADALILATEAFQNNRWHRSAMLAVELLCSAKALREPAVAMGRARFRAYDMSRCPVLQASIGGKRHPPPDYDAWLTRVGQAHEVYAAEPTSPESSSE